MRRVRAEDPRVVTDQMMDAGAAVLWASGLVEGQCQADRLVVADIFRAMLGASFDPTSSVTQP